jgi:hypothetical protein
MQHTGRALSFCAGKNHLEVEKSTVRHPCIAAAFKLGVLGVELSGAVLFVGALQLTACKIDYSECNFNGRLPSYVQSGALDLCVPLLVCIEASEICFAR